MKTYFHYPLFLLQFPYSYRIMFFTAQTRFPPLRFSKERGDKMTPEHAYILDHKTDIPSPADFYSHMHNEYEILYFIQGAARYQIENTLYELSPGDLLLIRPRSYHSLIPLEPKTYERFILHFSTGCIPEHLQRTAEQLAGLHRYPIGCVIHKRFEQIDEARKKGVEPADFTLLLDGLLNELLIHMKYHPPGSAPQATRLNDTLAKILDDIDRHPHEIVNVQALIRKHFVSRSWLEHSFREQLGMTPLQYINQKRVLYAQTLIQSGLSPTLAAETCRYNSYATFYRNYKKILHRSPGDNPSGSANKKAPDAP